MKISDVNVGYFVFQRLYVYTENTHIQHIVFKKCTCGAFTSDQVILLQICHVHIYNIVFCCCCAYRTSEQPGLKYLLLWGSYVDQRGELLAVLS